MKGRKRGLSLILTLSLILSLVGPLPARAADPVSGYHPDVVGAYLLPAQAANDSSFVRTEVLTANGLHVDGHFAELESEQNAVSVSGGNRNVLDPASTYMHSENRKWWTTYQWADMGETMRELLSTMQITANISASLTADRHMHLGTHKDLTDRAQAYLYAGYNTSPIVKVSNSSDDPDGVARTYTSSGVLTSGGTNLRFRMGATDCACGSSKVSKVYIYLTDTAAPTLTGIYVSDGAGNKVSRTAYKGGETLYLTLEMSEPIRFADGVAHDDLKLNLDLINASSGQSTGQTISAGLYALTGSKLIFSYAVPDQADYLVTSVSPSQQDWMTGTYDLKLLDERGSPMDKGNFTVSSLVTDLAGNPLSWTTGRELDSRLYLDDVAPGYTRLNAQGNMTQGYKVGTDGEWPSDITPSATWAGVGDYLAFTLTLNEEVGLWTGDSYARLTKDSGVTAVLNVKDSGGDPVEVGLSSVSYAMDNVNDVRNSTILTFQSFRPGDGMTLEGNAIRIVSLKAPDGSALSDVAGNSLDLTVELTPVEKLGLDVTPPGVTILDGQVNVKNVELSGNGRYVTIPFTVTDAVGSGVALGQEVALGIDIATAFTVRYCITDSADAPDKDNSAYRLLSYQQPTCPLPASTNDTYYLHICCSNLSWDTDPATGKMPLSVSITCQDYAGNTASDTVDYDIPFDQTDPEISLPTTFTVSGEGEISVPFSVSDSTHLASVTVQWNQGEASELLDSGNASASFSGTATYTTTDTSGSATLTVTAQDKAGNSSTETKTYTYNLTTVNRYTLGGDPAVATGSPSLTLSAPGNQGGGGAAGNELVTVAVLGDGAGSYNLYTVAGSESGKNIFSATPDAVVTGIAVTKKSVTLSGYASGSGWATSSAYGDLPVTIFTLRESGWETAIAAADADGTVNVTSLSEVESFHMKVLTGSSYTVTIGTPQDSDGTDVTAALVTQQTSKMVQTLTGLRVPITLTTGRDDAYTLQDINYDASYIELKGLDKFDEPTIEVPGSKQFFQKPENGTEIVYPISVPLYNTSGKYQVKVSLTYLDGTTKEFTGPELYMYDLTSDEFGPTKLNQNNSASRAFRTVELSEDATQISLGFTGSSNATLYFDSFVAPTTKMNLYNTGPVSLDIWNESLGENAVHVKNYPALLNYTPLTLQMYSEGASSPTTLYLMEGENIVRYRALLPNGNYTAAKTLIITVHNADPTFEVEFTPNGAGGLRMQLTDLSEDAKEALALNGRTLRLAATKSNMETSTNLITVTLDSNLGLDLTRAELAENWKDSPLLQLMDEYGNFTTVTVNPRYDIDIQPPAISCYNSYTELKDGAYKLVASITDTYVKGDYSDGLDFNSFALTFQYSDGETVEVSLPVASGGTWTGSGADHHGIYQVKETEGSQTDARLEIYGQFPYGSSGTVKITLSCRDNQGNAGTDQNEYNHAYWDELMNCTCTAEAPTVTASGGEGQVTLTSDLPIRVLDPVPTDTDGTFATTHTLPVYTNSATIQYEDVFGNLYTKDITASPFGENLTVSLSETAATRGPVTLTATATGEGSTITALTSEKNGSGTISGSTATLELTSNDTVTITLSDETTHTVQVTNIDNAVETVTVAFYGPDGQLLNAGIGAESVTGPVTAALQCAELLVGETSHVFPIGSAQGSTYTFQVTDLLGNTTTVTATLPWAVVQEEGAAAVQDTAQPEYTVSLYTQRSGGWTQINSYDSQIQPPEGATEDLSLTGLAKDLPDQSGQAIRLAFSIRDDSPVNLIVKSGNGVVPGYNDASDSISGLTVTGSTLTWEGTSGNPVYVYLVDSQGIAADALELTFPAVDKTPPTATVEYVSEGSSLSEPPVRAYLVPNSNDASDFTVLDTGNLTLDEDEMSSHKGQYYYNFTTNGSYTFRFSDAAGNVATVTATVHSIDTTEPEVGSIQWLNRSISYTDAAWETAQSSLHTNAPVTAILTLNTQLKGVTVQGGTTDVTTSFMANQAQVTFSANTGEVKLTLTARNGQTTEITLDAVTCIDTAAPGVTVSGDDVTSSGSNTYTVNGTDKRSVELTFTTDEATAGDLTTAENSTDGKFRTTHTYTASRNGEVTLTFTDRAGNVTQVTLNIQDLDNKLALSFSKSGSDDDAVADPAKLELQTGQTFYVKSTRNVTVTLGNVASGQATKGTWTQFTLPDDPGLVILKAEDKDENTVYAYLTVELPDTVPPVISLPSQIVYAQAGAENLDLLQDGVTVTDNGEGGVTASVNAENVTWDTPGSYTVTYTATDASGNSSTVTRTLVLTREAPIGLTVNGQTVYQGSTLTLSKGTASLTLQGVDTPVYLALKQGYKTVAQMKLNAQVLLNGSYTGALSASLNTTGFYTLYLRTQDRTEYVFYLYVKG